MIRTTLLKRVEGLELWTGVTEGVQHYAVKLGTRRARVFPTLEAAEAMLAKQQDRAREARAH